MVLRSKKFLFPLHQWPPLTTDLNPTNTKRNITERWSSSPHCLGFVAACLRSVKEEIWCTHRLWNEIEVIGFGYRQQESDQWTPIIHFFHGNQPIMIGGRSTGTPLFLTKLNVNIYLWHAKCVILCTNWWYCVWKFGGFYVWRAKGKFPPCWIIKFYSILSKNNKYPK